MIKLFKNWKLCGLACLLELRDMQESPISLMPSLLRIKESLQGHYYLNKYSRRSTFSISSSPVANISIFRSYLILILSLIFDVSFLYIFYIFYCCSNLHWVFNTLCFNHELLYLYIQMLIRQSSLRRRWIYQVHKQFIFILFSSLLLSLFFNYHSLLVFSFLFYFYYLIQLIILFLINLSILRC